MANQVPAPAWRSLAVWSAVGAVFYILALLGGTALLRGDGPGAIFGALFRSERLAAMLGLGLVFSMAVIGFTNRKRPVSLQSLRNFAIRDAVVMIVFLLAVWGGSRLAAAGVLGAMSVSERVAAGTGAVLVLLAFLGSLVTASAHTRVDVIGNEVAAEELRERGRLFLCSFAWMAACGLLLIGLSLAGHGGVLPPATALAVALVLIAVLTALGIAAWRLSDELGRVLSRETGHVAFYLVLPLGGGWAMLAHLGFTASPAPLDWLTLFTVLFAASFIAVGRRKLLVP